MNIETIATFIIALIIIASIGNLYFRWNAESKRQDEEIETLKKLNVVQAKRQSEIDYKVLGLEVKSDSGFPLWRKTCPAGTYIYVKPCYSAMILAPLKMVPADLYGKTDEQVQAFSANLKKTLTTLDSVATTSGYASAHGVVFHAKIRPMTVIKRMVSMQNGDVTFEGLAYPEFSPR